MMETRARNSPSRRGRLGKRGRVPTKDIKEVEDLVELTYPPALRTHLAALRGWAGVLTEAYNELAWDLLYIGYWLMTPVIPGLEPITEGSRAPVVIVPGFCGRPRSFRRMRDRIAMAGHPVFVFESGWQMGSIPRKSRELSELLSRHGLEEVIVVGHSMGGLIAAEAMIRGENRIKRMIAVGVPFHGSYLALAGLVLLVALLSFCISDSRVSVPLMMAILSIPATRQMLPGSDFLATVRGQYDRIAEKVTCIWTQADNVLLVAASSLLLPEKDTEKAVLCEKMGHAHLLFGEAAHDLIVHQLANAGQ